MYALEDTIALKVRSLRLFDTMKGGGKEVLGFLPTADHIYQHHLCILGTRRRYTKEREA